MELHISVKRLIVMERDSVVRKLFSSVSDPHFFADPDLDPSKNLHADTEVKGFR